MGMALNIVWKGWQVMNSGKIDVEALSEKLQNVFPMPQILAKIMKAVNDPNASASSIEQVFKYEPSFTLKILGLANSAYYGSSGKITNIRTAITLLGFNLIKSLAIHASVNELFQGGSNNSLFSGVDLWKHSVGVGVCAKMIARRQRLGNAEDYFTMGILHDVGLIIEFQFYREDFNKLIGRIQDADKSIIDIEEELLGTNHGTLTKLLCEKWQLPKEMSGALAYHHDPLGAPEDMRKIAAAIYLSNTIVHEKQLGFVYPTTETVTVEILGLLGIEDVDYEILLEDFDQEILELAKMFD